jgi:hypothetical protein
MKTLLSVALLSLLSVPLVAQEQIVSVSEWAPVSAVQSTQAVQSSIQFSRPYTGEELLQDGSVPVPVMETPVQATPVYSPPVYAQPTYAAPVYSSPLPVPVIVNPLNVTPAPAVVPSQGGCGNPNCPNCNPRARSVQPVRGAFRTARSVAGGVANGVQAGLAQQKAEIAARGQIRGHVGGGLGGANYEGVGFSNVSPQHSIKNCCYWGTRPVAQIGVSKGNDGVWYSCVLYN